jgi:Zn-dependent protease with chaperone function
MPDVLGSLGRSLNPLVEGRGVTTADYVRAAIGVALPGLAIMAIVTAGLRRVWARSPLFEGGDIPGRAPDHTDLGEARLANVVDEMAIAAGIPAPRIVIVPGGVNAAACGRDESHVTILAGHALAASVTREQLEGMIAHLVASIANGDMTIGLRVTTTLALFGLFARVGTSFNDRREFLQTARMWRVFLTPTSEGTLALLGSLANPFQDPAAPAPRERRATGSGDLTWREWLTMPLMGPIVLSGFMAGMVTEFFLEPLIALAWRQRKYMADATAVQLTRDPDGLAAALASVGESGGAVTPWTAHLAVAADRQSQGPFGTSIVPIFPSAEKRGAALVRMGAHISPAAKRPIPPLLMAIFIALGAVIAGLLALVVYLLVIVSTALSGLFTIFPAAAIHFLLRWMAGR